MSIQGGQFYESLAARANIAVPHELSGEPIPLMDEEMRYHRQRPNSMITTQVDRLFEDAMYLAGEFICKASTLEATGTEAAPTYLPFSFRTFRGFAERLFERKVPTEVFANAALEAIAPQEAPEMITRSALSKARQRWIKSHHMEEAAYFRVSADAYVRGKYAGKTACLALIIPDELSFSTVSARLYTGAYTATARTILEQEAAGLGQ